MNNIDRILRIIYRELNISDLIDKIDYKYSEDYSFNLKNKDLKEKIAMRYATVYPDNYSFEEVLNILNFYNDKIKKYSYNDTPDFYNLFYLCAEQLLSVKNNDLLVSFDNLLEWDGICNKIDASIVIAAYLAANSLSYSNKNVNTGAVLKHDNSSINSILLKGAADNHMHFSASGYSADMSWACLMTCSFYEEKHLKEFVAASSMMEEGFCRSIDDGILLIKKIKIIRLILEELFRCTTAVDKTKLCKKDIIKILKSSSDSVFIDFNDWIETELDKLEEKYSKSRADVKNYYKSERNFLSDIFTYLSSNHTDPIYPFLFNIYLSGLCKIRFHFVQDNSGMGFEKFKFRESVKDDWFKLATVNKKHIVKKQDLCESVFDRCYYAKCVKFAEFRVTLNKVSQLSDFISDLDKANDDVYVRYKSDKVEKIQYGLVLHFIKEKDCNKPMNGSYRWEKYRSKILKASNKLINYIEGKHKFYKKLVGIDAANYEVNCRPEVFADTFRRLKSTVALEKKFGFTFHVGETFETLCSGIRAIDETVEFMNFSDGDRLGHAIALGIDVDLFREKKRDLINLCLGTYVDDIAWMYYTIQNYEEGDQTKLIIYLRSQFDRYKIQLFANVKRVKDINAIDILSYIDSWILRGDAPSVYFDNDSEYDKREWQVNKKIKGHKRASLNDLAVNLYKIYLSDGNYYDNSKKAVCINPEENYWEALSLVQRIIHKKVYDRKIAIETNPSSNRKISPVSKFIELPFIHFNSFGLTFDNAHKREDIPISINTDDGSIFQSDLANEYALVSACLYREKYDLQEIYQYIDYLRGYSIIQTFIDTSENNNIKNYYNN